MTRRAFNSKSDWRSFKSSRAMCW